MAGISELAKFSLKRNHPFTPIKCIYFNKILCLKHFIFLWYRPLNVSCRHLFFVYCRPYSWQYFPNPVVKRALKRGSERSTRLTSSTGRFHSRGQQLRKFRRVLFTLDFLGTPTWPPSLFWYTNMAAVTSC